jgi:hypothetical protein
MNLLQKSEPNGTLSASPKKWKAEAEPSKESDKHALKNGTKFEIPTKGIF